MAPIASRPFLLSERGGVGYGAIAQLGERIVRNDEVGGSIPPGSTTLRLRLRVARPRKSKAKRARRSPEGEDESLPRKSRRPLLDEACNSLAKIGARQRDHHLAVGIDGGFRKRLEGNVVKLPLDDRHGARRYQVGQFARIGVS